MYINAISYYLPEEKLGNASIIEDYLHFKEKDDPDGPSIEDVYNYCWIKQRYVSAHSDSSKDLGNRAALKLFEEWDIAREEIDYLIFVSDALEYKGPTTACVMQADLGLRKSIGAIDVLHGCTGYIYGLNLAKLLIMGGQARKVLLITSDTPTKVIHPSDWNIRAIFSDGAAATLISDKKIPSGINASIGGAVFGTDGKGEHILKVERSGTRNPADAEWLFQFKHIYPGLLGGRLRMNAPQIFLFALRTVPQLVEDILEKEGLEKEEVDFFVPHQANGQMLNFLRKRLKVKEEKFCIDITDVGNTVSSSIPIALYRAYQAQRISKGNKVLLAGFGIGLSWGACMLYFK